MPRESLRVLVVAPYPALRIGLRELLRESGFEVVGEADAPSAVDLPAVADVVVADLGDDGAGFVDAGESPALPTVFLVGGGIPRIAASDLGAPGAWIARDVTAEELDAAIRAVAAGMLVLDPEVAAGALDGSLRASAEAAEDVHLTGREVEVLRLLALGLPNKGIALELGISEHTVKFHVGAVLAKLDARSRTEAVTLAARRGLLTL